MNHRHPRLRELGGALLVSIALCSVVHAQCGKRPRGETLVQTVDEKPDPKEVAFVRAQFPIVLEPDPNSGEPCFIAIPIERLEDKGCRVTFKLLVEEWDASEPGPIQAARDDPQQARHVSLVMQRPKTRSPSGFCASARRLPVGEPCETTLSYSSKPPENFYAAMHVAPWVKRVTILGVELSEGHRIIEKAPPATVEQEESIRDWVGQLADDHYEVRHKAHRALVEFGVPATPILQGHLNDADPERRVRIREIIGEIGRIEQLRMPPVKMGR